MKGAWVYNLTIIYPPNTNMKLKINDELNDISNDFDIESDLLVSIEMIETGIASGVVSETIDTLQVGMENLVSIAKTITSHEITPGVTGLIGDVILSEFGLALDDSNKDEVLEAINTSKEHIGTQILDLLKKVWAWICEALYKLFHRLSRLIHNYEKRYKWFTKVLEDDEWVLKSWGMTMDKGGPSRNKEMVTVYLPKGGRDSLSEVLKSFEQMANTAITKISEDKWKDTNSAFKILTVDYVDKVEKELRVVYSDEDRSKNTIEAVTFDNRYPVEIQSGIKKAYDFGKSTHIALKSLSKDLKRYKIKTITYEAAGAERNPAEILQLCNRLQSVLYRATYTYMYQMYRVVIRIKVPNRLLAKAKQIKIIGKIDDVVSY